MNKKKVISLFQQIVPAIVYEKAIQRAVVVENDMQKTVWLYENGEYYYQIDDNGVADKFSIHTAESKIVIIKY